VNGTLPKRETHGLCVPPESSKIDSMAAGIDALNSNSRLGENVIVYLSTRSKD